MSIENLLGESYRGVFRSLVTVGMQPVASGHFRETVQPVMNDAIKSLNCLYTKWFPPLPEQLLTMPFPTNGNPFLTWGGCRCAD